MLQKIASKYLEKVAGKPLPDESHPYWYLTDDMAIIESLNGQKREGDFVDGTPYSKGLLHIRGVFPNDLEAYKKRRQGMNMTMIPVLDDVNDMGYNFTADDILDDYKARQIAVLYLDRYGRAYKKATGKEPTREILLRIWNGGPAGYKKDSTLRYVSTIDAMKANPEKYGFQLGVITPAATPNKTQVKTPTTVVPTTNTPKPVVQNTPTSNPNVRPSNAVNNAPGTFEDYTVVKNDTLSDLAHKRGFRKADAARWIDEVVKLNNLPNANTIQIDKKLRLPLK